MYRVYDSYGTLLRGGFHSKQDAYNWIFATGNNPNHKVVYNGWCVSQWSLKNIR